MDPSSNDKSLSPFVYWGQSSDKITLRVDLKNVKSPTIDLKHTSLEFQGSGIGAKGFNEYSFNIDFFAEVNPSDSFYKLNDRHIEFVIKKKDNLLWPRLLASVVRPQWIKVDFDRIQPEEESDAEDDGSLMGHELDELIPNQQNSYRNFGQKDFGRRKKSMNKGFKVEDFKKSYLFLYNLLQFVGFLYVFLIIAIRFCKDGIHSFEYTYQLVGKAIKFLHLMQILEVIHPLMGYTVGSPVMPFIQLSGRALIIFIMIGSEPKIQTNPWVSYLFISYSAIEILRYLYYMLHVFKVNIWFITWMRYTAWVVNYPLGFVCEGVILFENIALFEESRRFAIELPNMLNFSFNFPTIIRIYLLIGFFPVLYFMMSHMYRQRVKVLYPNRSKVKSN
ncbi:very-long-chain (3R)-3-hydroxyacyl-CoA dehydratase 3-like [Oppia nitens]|uniref:very-long-chain (3R)-3-hydroxyacyl-CoA dehydratase 3-like n=1 Tax=Oppia nitens TaxID=1686743 RepID=UPI0023DC6D39|nr:very-long-chain (3R)-3-hydroxyacyl-CoA dehydratase 3-like [Oppia nitens]